MKEEDQELEFGNLNEDFSQRKVSEKTLVDGIIKPRLNEIFTMVGMNLSEVGVAGKTPSGVVLTGGGALCIGAPEAARRMLSLPTRVGNPAGVTGLVDEINTPAFASSVGLLIYATEEEGFVDSSWSPGGFISKVRIGIPKGLLGRASNLFKKILP